MMIFSRGSVFFNLNNLCNNDIVGIFKKYL